MHTKDAPSCIARAGLLRDLATTYRRRTPVIVGRISSHAVSDPASPLVFSGRRRYTRRHTLLAGELSLIAMEQSRARGPPGINGRDIYSSDIPKGKIGDLDYGNRGSNQS